MPDLIAPTTRLHNAWLDAHAEWGSGLHEDGFGLAPTDEVHSPAGFAAWVARLADESEQVTCRWIVEWVGLLGAGRMLDEARVLGMKRVLVVCAADNVVSVRTIERVGGVFEEIRDTGHGPVRRYWITAVAPEA